MIVPRIVNERDCSKKIPEIMQEIITEIVHKIVHAINLEIVNEKIVLYYYISLTGAPVAFKTWR